MQPEDDYEYENFSILSSPHACNSVILVGKRDSCRNSTTGFSENVVVAGTSYQMLEVLSFCYRERAKPSPIKINSLIFQVKKSTMKLSRLLFETTIKNLKLIPVLVLVPRLQV